MTSGIVLTDGERPIVSSPAKLLGRKHYSHTGGEFGSVGLRASHVTVRVGGWSGDQTPMENDLEPIDSGNLVKTDRRVAFLGAEHEVEVHLADLVAWHLEGRVLRIYAERHAEPYLFQVDAAPDVLLAWSDPASDPSAPLDTRRGGWIQPGFPKRILLDDQETVVDADLLLPFAAAFLDTWPSGRLVDAQEVARALGISYGRARSMMPQLEALGFASRPDADGERAVFDPDGLTIPLVARDAPPRDDDAAPDDSHGEMKDTEAGD